MKMKHITPFIVGFCMSGAIALPGLVTASDQSDPHKFFIQEHVGSFRYGLPSKEVTHLIGNPEQLTVGEQTEDWNYVRKGIFLVMGKDSKGAWVKQITVTMPSKLEAARGVRIGMPWAKAQKLYGEWKNPPGFKMNWFWVGDLKAGLGFEVIDEKISKIILGEAPAECIEPTIGGSHQ